MYCYVIIYLFISVCRLIPCSDETLGAAQERYMRRGQSDETGLRTDPERALHMQLKQLMSQIASLLEEKKIV